MKKLFFICFILVVSVSLYAADQNSTPAPPPRTLFIEGASTRPEHRAYFLASFRREATGTGIDISYNRDEAGYIFRFDVETNIIFYDDGSQRPAPPDEPQHVIRISIFRNTDGLEIVTITFYFSELEEMDEYNQLLFTTAISHIPPERGAWYTRRFDTSWSKNQLFLRTSLDYYVTIFALQPTGLIGGQGVYHGDITDPVYIAAIDHEFVTYPGATVGAEYHPFTHLSIEGNFKVFMGYPGEMWFLNMEAGAEVKVPVILGGYMISPYAAVSIPLNVAPIFTEYPKFTLGGGIQICAGGLGTGAFFVDVKYFYAFQDVYRKNFYGTLAPNPPEIHYKRSQLGIGVGYKFGFFPKD